MSEGHCVRLPSGGERESKSERKRNSLSARGVSKGIGVAAIGGDFAVTSMGEPDGKEGVVIGVESETGVVAIVTSE